jgi:uncharacterized repeat protein (TIGR01451 family)
MTAHTTPSRRAKVVVSLCAPLVLIAGTCVAAAGSVVASAPGHSHKRTAHGRDYQRDLSPKLRDLPKIPAEASPLDDDGNPKTKVHHHDRRDTVVQATAAVPSMPSPLLTFDGVAFPGVTCSCAPPDTNGEVGLTQYAQTVNKGLQVFSTTTGASVYGPVAIATIWGGFGGVCETNGDGDPVLLYDQFANRWLVSQFAGSGVPTDECIAISATSDATGSYYRYAFHLGSNFYDYPHLAVWPDGYYLTDNVFDSAGDTYLGPQPFAFDRTQMLTGAAATFVTTAGPLGGTQAAMLPADVDGSTPPPAGAPESFVQFPAAGAYSTYHFHVDFSTPANSTWTTFAAPAAAGFTSLCPGTRACVPEPNGDYLDGIGDRLMFRLAYRNFGDHESVVGTYTVNSGGVAGVRWFELRNVTSGPETVFQESTYQPDSAWRWLGSAAMDASGDLAVGYSVSSQSVVPGIDYAGRLSSDPLNTLAQGEATLFAGAGSQSGSGNRWGDYSDLTVDPVDDCTFWYTNEYYPAGSTSYNWRTRVGSFKFPSCSLAPKVDISKVADAFTANFGAPIGFTVTLANNTSTNALGLTVNDSLPAGPNVNWSVDAANTDAGWSMTGSPPNQSVVYSPTQLAAHTTTHVHVVSGTGSGSCRAYPNTASFTTSNLGSDSATATETVVGPPHVTLAENFDGVTAPALPTGWTATDASGPTPLWVTSTTSPDTAPNTAFVDDPGVVSDKQLVSPPIAITTDSAQVSFRSNYDLETNYDGGVLEISIDGGAFADILAAGGSFVTGAYNQVISSSYSNPLAGRLAWTGSSGGWVTTTANLPASAAGHSVQLRWRMGSDTSNYRPGWSVDGVSITDGSDCSSGPSITSISPTSGPLGGGQTVTVNGTDFTGATAVRFGSTPGTSVNVISPSKLTVVSPAHAAGVVPVRVTTPEGTSPVVPADRYTYAAAPTVTSVSPTSGPLAGGQTVTVRGTGFTGATVVKFAATPGTSLVVASATRLTVVSPAHAAGMVHIRVTTPAGTSAAVVADHYTFAAAPTITSISPKSGPVAGGQTVTVNGTDFTGVTAVRFGTTPGTSVSVISATQLTVVSPAHAAGHVPIRVVTRSGTSPLVTADRYTYS